MSDIKTDLDDWVWKNAQGISTVGGLIPTDAAVAAAVRVLDPVWDARPRPEVGSDFKGDLHFRWKSPGRGCGVRVSAEGVVTSYHSSWGLDRWQSADCPEPTSAVLLEMIDWGLSGERPTTTPPPQGFGPRVLDAVVDRVLPWWARPIVKGPVMGGVRFVTRQLSKIDPATIDRLGASVRGKVQVCRDYWRNLDAKP